MLIIWLVLLLLLPLSLSGKKPQEQDFKNLFESLAWLTDLTTQLRLATKNDCDTKNPDVAISPFWVDYMIDLVKGGVPIDGNTLKKQWDILQSLKSWKDSMTTAQQDGVVNTLAELMNFFNGTSDNGQTFINLINAKANANDVYSKTNADNTFAKQVNLNNYEPKIVTKNSAFNRNFAPMVANPNRPNADVVPRAVDTFMDRGGYSGDLNALHSAEHMGVYAVWKAVTNAPSGFSGDARFFVIPYNGQEANGFGCGQFLMSPNMLAYRHKWGASWDAWNIYYKTPYRMLAMGRVDADGNKVSGKYPAGWGVQRVTTGNYRIDHNIGHTNYEVICQSMKRMIDAVPYNMGTNSFWVYRSGSTDHAFYDAEFSFQVWGYE